MKHFNYPNDRIGGAVSGDFVIHTRIYTGQKLIFPGALISSDGLL
jgi:hypothetical protein